MFFFFMFVLLFVYATIAHYPGTHLWGYVGLLWTATLQIIAGMFFACFDPPHHAHHIWIKQMKRMTSRLIRIFFADTAAFPIPVTKLLSLEAFWKRSILGISRDICLRYNQGLLRTFHRQGALCHGLGHYRKGGEHGNITGGLCR